VHQSKCTSTRLGQHSGLGDPVLKKCQLHRLRPVCPEIVRNRIGGASEQQEGARSHVGL
jgi:hypothetical protein